QRHHGSAYGVLQIVFFFQAEDGIRDRNVTGVQTCALPIFEAMLRIRHEVRQLEGPLYTDLPYDIVFNEKVVTILRNPEVQSELSQYITRLNELLDESTFFNRESFSFYNATNVTKSLSSNGFFTANHSLLLHGESK